MAEEIFRRIKDYGYLHSSHFITKAISRAVEERIPSVQEYLGARLKDADDFFRDNRTQKEIKSNLLWECPALGEYGMQ